MVSKFQSNRVFRHSRVKYKNAPVFFIHIQPLSVCLTIPERFQPLLTEYVPRIPVWDVQCFLLFVGSPGRGRYHNAPRTTAPHTALPAHTQLYEPSSR